MPLRDLRTMLTRLREEIDSPAEPVPMEEVPTCRV
jgi:hypothetical protein